MGIELLGVAIVQTPVPMPPRAPFPPGVIEAGPPPYVMVSMVFIVGILVLGVVLWPLIRAWGRRIEGRSVDPSMMNEIGQLRARVAELEHGQARMAELEERVDFSERLLTQGREAEMLKRDNA